MNKRWYISALVITLALLGGFVSQEQNTTPNQEIVLQFASKTVTNDETQSAITTVKQQLEAIGIHDIQVTKNDGGQLKITYFSTIDIASVKSVLSKKIKLKLQDSGIDNKNRPYQIPYKDSSVAYNLDVYEIQNGSDTAFHLSGKLALEHKADNDRFSNTNPYANTKALDYSFLEQQVKNAYKFHKYSGITIDYKSNKIPEVRAGPNTQGVFGLAKS